MRTAATRWAAFPGITPDYQRLTAQTLDVRRTNRFGQQVPALLPWFADTDAGPLEPFGNGPWAVETTEDQLLVGGEFYGVNPFGPNEVASQGLTRFRLPPAPGVNTTLPELQPAPDVYALEPDRVVVAWRPTWDRDDLTLTHEVLRDGVVVHTRQVTTAFWDRPRQTWTDTDVAPGEVHTYRLRVRDPSGNTSGSPTAAPVLVPDVVPSDAYARTVLTDGAVSHWRLDDADASDVLVDRLGRAPLQVQGPVTTGVDGALAGGTGSAVELAGDASARSASRRDGEPDLVSVEAWFRVEPGATGVVVTRVQPGVNRATERALYVDDDGHLRFAVRPRAQLEGDPVRSLVSAAPVDDGRWHHAVGTLSTRPGQRLYLDGVLVGEDVEVTTGAKSDPGGWQVGTGDAAFLPGLSAGAEPLVGRVDEVAVYDRQLSPEQVAAHFRLGNDGAVEPPPDPDPPAPQPEPDPPAPQPAGPTRSPTRHPPAPQPEPDPPAPQPQPDPQPPAPAPQPDPDPPAPAPQPQPDPPLVSDDFSSPVQRGFGVGPAWDVLWRTGDYAVAGGAGSVSVPREGAERSAWLSDVDLADVTLELDVALDALPAPGLADPRLRPGAAGRRPHVARRAPRGRPVGSDDAGARAARRHLGRPGARGRLARRPRGDARRAGAAGGPGDRDGDDGAARRGP